MHGHYFYELGRFAIGADATVSSEPVALKHPLLVPDFGVEPDDMLDFGEYIGPFPEDTPKVIVPPWYRTPPIDRIAIGPHVSGYMSLVNFVGAGTLAIAIETSYDEVRWFPVLTFTPLAAADGVQAMHLTGVLLDWVRCTYVSAGGFTGDLEVLMASVENRQ